MLLIENRKQQSNGVGEDHTSAVLISNAVAIRLEKGMINLSKNYRFGDRRGQLIAAPYDGVTRIRVPNRFIDVTTCRRADRVLALVSMGRPRPPPAFAQDIDPTPRLDDPATIDVTASRSVKLMPS